jgi:hypothetical protein
MLSWVSARRDSVVVSWKELASVQTDPSGSGDVCEPLAAFWHFIFGLTCH